MMFILFLVEHDQKLPHPPTPTPPPQAHEKNYYSGPIYKPFYVISSVTIMEPI